MNTHGSADDIQPDAHSEAKPLPETLAPRDNGSGIELNLSASAGRRSTVLPKVESEGERLVIKPRSQVRYESRSVLGRGGMGEVQLATDNDIGRCVAVKRLLDQTSPQAIARFVDEVQTVGNLEHPNIAPLHDVGVDENGDLFFVMKYIQGETLAAIIRKLALGDAEYHRRYGFEARLSFFVGLIRALQYAHNQGLLHRDIKPQNVMVGPFGEVMLMDWGLVRRTTDSTTTMPAATDGDSTRTMDGSLVGTPSYMSPEQARGETSTLDARSDLYSAFVVLFELLTTKSYVEPSESITSVVADVVKREPPKAHDSSIFESPHQDAVPAEWRHFLRRGLANSPADRFDDAEAVLLEIERLRSGACAVHCPVTFVKAASSRFERIIDNHPLAGLAAVVVVSAACLSGVIGWCMWGHRMFQG